MSARPQRFDQAEACIDWLIETVGQQITVGAPLGLGKPATLLNALYRRAKADSGLDLTIITALSLQPPQASSDLEKRLMNPIVERVFEDYPGLDYVADLKAGALPDNVVVSEFFFLPGDLLGNAHAQRHYRSVNYTHVARDLVDAGVNVLMQMVAPNGDGQHFSLSSNTDVTLDLIPVVETARERSDNLVVVAQANAQMPYMTRSAEVDASLADALFEGEAADFKPFGAPAVPVTDPDYAIALRVSTLLADGGTLQIGIGSLSDAIAYCCDLRHNQNDDYRRLVDAARLTPREQRLIDAIGDQDPFEQGLYGCTEMLVEAYIQMYRSGVIKRCVYDDIALQTLLDDGRIAPEVSGDTLTALVEAEAICAQLTEDDVAYLKRFGVFHEQVSWQKGLLYAGDGAKPIAPDLHDSAARLAIEAHCLGERLAGATLVHGGFFLGPTSFYDSLRGLSAAERDLFHMTSVGEINHLYGNEALRRVQRRRARFVNTAIKVTLSGAITSDGLDNGQVLSGVGGQYNFVAQGHALTDGRSIICVRAARSTADGPESNIVSAYGHTTVPRHLRDIVITEYGIAHLRGKTDEQVAIALIEIADARFQDELREAAVKAGKLASGYQIPEAARANTPQRVTTLFAAGKKQGRFAAYPYGSDFTEIEQSLIAALRSFQGKSPRKMLTSFVRHANHLKALPEAATPYLERMELAEPKGVRETLLARVVVLALMDYGTLDG